MQLLQELVKLIEAYKDLGKLSDEILNKGQALSKDDSDNFQEVSGRVFHKIVVTIGKAAGLS